MKLEFKKLKVDSKPGRNATMNVLELKDYLDFEVKRVYYINEVVGNTGQHSHLKEKELFVMIAGTCTAVIDQGRGLEDIPFATGETIHVGNYVWHGFKDFSENSIVLAISSTNYNPNREDYIEEYEKYKLAQKKILSLS